MIVAGLSSLSCHSVVVVSGGTILTREPLSLWPPRCLFVGWVPGLVWSDRRVAVIEKTFHIKLTTINHSISQINKLFSLFLHLNAVSDWLADLTGLAFYHRHQHIIIIILSSSSMDPGSMYSCVLLLPRERKAWNKCESSGGWWWSVTTPHVVLCHNNTNKVVDIEILYVSGEIWSSQSHCQRWNYLLCSIILI